MQVLPDMTNQHVNETSDHDTKKYELLYEKFKINFQVLHSLYKNAAAISTSHQVQYICQIQGYIRSFIYFCFEQFEHRR